MEDKSIKSSKLKKFRRIFYSVAFAPFFKISIYLLVLVLLATFRLGWSLDVVAVFTFLFIFCFIIMLFFREEAINFTKVFSARCKLYFTFKANEKFFGKIKCADLINQKQFDCYLIEYETKELIKKSNRPNFITLFMAILSILFAIYAIVYGKIQEIDLVLLGVVGLLVLLDTIYSIFIIRNDARILLNRYKSFEESFLEVIEKELSQKQNKGIKKPTTENKKKL